MTVASILEAIGPVKTLLGLLGAVLVAGVGIGATLPAYRSLPAKVASAEASVESLRRDVDEIKKVVSQSLCLSVAEKAKTPWEGCIPGLDTKR